MTLRARRGSQPGAGEPEPPPEPGEGYEPGGSGPPAQEPGFLAIHLPDGIGDEEL